MSALDEIRSRLEAATPGPWEYEPSSGHVFSETITDDGHEAIGVSFMENDADGVLVAHAPTDVARLLAAVEAVLELAPAFEAEATASENTAKEILSNEPNRGWVLVATEHEHHAVVARNHAARIRAVLAALTGPES